jgi:ATP-dependent Lhr-like helicase
LLASVAAKVAIESGEIEPLSPQWAKLALDVLAQQIVAIAAWGIGARDTLGLPISVDEVFSLVRHATSYEGLSRKSFEGVLDMLSGRYPSTDFSELRPRLTWDRRAGLVSARPYARRLAVLNGGTIPERGLYGVFLEGSTAKPEPKSLRVGELDEEMVFELRVNDTFFLGASSWRVVDITHDRVVVRPAKSAHARTPFWHGDRPGRSAEFGARIGELARNLSLRDEPAARTYLERELGIEHEASALLAEYIHTGVRELGVAPSDECIVVERFRDELGDHRICILSPFGSRVHAPWAMAIHAMLSRQRTGDIEALYSDDGIVLRVPEGDAPPPLDALLLLPSEVRAVVTEVVAHTALFAARFREAAGRALLLPKRLPGKRTPLWALRKRSRDLQAVASQYPQFPLMLEVHRECLADTFDMDGLVALLERIASQTVRVHSVETTRPSVFSKSLMFSFVANFVYDGDAPQAERRAQALMVDASELRALLGEEAVRTLFDPSLVATLEETLQRATYKLASADALADLLLLLGDRSLEEIASRFVSQAAAAAAIKELLATQRAVTFSMAGEERLVAVEDAALFRDAFGLPLPPDLPAWTCEPVADACQSVFLRYARTHGPFSAAQLHARYGVPVPDATRVLDGLVHVGRLSQGEYGARGDGTAEYVEREVLRLLRRRTLASLREEIEPVSPAVYTRFLLEWHGIEPLSRTSEIETEARERRILDVVAHLSGLALPYSVLERDVFPARVPSFRVSDLDALMASGQVRWVGVERLGPRDGRVMLQLAESEVINPVVSDSSISPLALRIRDFLAQRGAVFFQEIVRGLGGFAPEIATAISDLIWTGHVTNDTFAPLRSILMASENEAPRGRASRARLSRSGRAQLTAARLPGTEGRFSLVQSTSEPNRTATESTLDLVNRLLERHGVLLRECVAAEGIPGGFSALYAVLSALEERSALRRGYFVEGRSAAQFAVPEATDRLRAARTHRDGALYWLSALDPATPYGASLPWPSNDGRPARSAGAHVAIVDGWPIAWLSRGNEGAVTFPGSFEDSAFSAAAACAKAIAASFRSSGADASIVLRIIDGVDASAHPARAMFEHEGFVARGSTLTLSRGRLQGD